MKGLFVCCTPYQIMIATLLKFQTNQDNADIIITDTFGNYEKIAKRLENTGCFDKVLIAHIKKYVVVKTGKEKLNKIDYIIRFKKHLQRIVPNPSLYSDVFFNCEDIFLFNLVSWIKSRNANSKVYRYEEGYSTYSLAKSSSNKSIKIVNARNCILAHNVKMEWDGLFLFEPDLYEFSNPIKKMQIDRSVIKNQKYVDIIKNVFSTEEISTKYKKEVIIFEESFFSDGFEIDDFEVYSRIISEIGCEHFSIKMHPRSKKNRFENMNVDVHLPEGVPWEAILLTGSFSNCVFLALASGSVINSRLLTGDSTRSFLLYKCLKHKPAAFDLNFERFVENFHAKYNDGLYIPQTIEEAVNEMKKVIK